MTALRCRLAWPLVHDGQVYETGTVAELPESLVSLLLPDGPLEMVGQDVPLTVLPPQPEPASVPKRKR